MLSIRCRSGGGSVRAGDAGRRPTPVDPLGAARHPHARRAQHGPVRSQTALRRYGHHSAPSSSAAADGALLGRSFSTSNLVFLVCRSLSVARSRRLSLHFVVPAQVVEPISTTAAGMARTFFQDAFVFHVFSVLDPVGGGGGSCRCRCRFSSFSSSAFEKSSLFIFSTPTRRSLLVNQAPASSRYSSFSPL